METGHTRSAWAAGWATFAAAMLMLIGTFHGLSGVAGVGGSDSTVYVATPDYIFEFSATTWGWIHIVMGIILFASGIGILLGNVLARTVGVFVALLSAFTNFAFIPTYPVWAIVMIAVNVCVIWALTVHGRDVVEEV